MFLERKSFMMNYIWGFIMLISIVCAIITGRISMVSNAVLTGADEGVTLALKILGMMAFWTGIMKIANDSGITGFLAKIFSPILKLIFPEYSKKKNVLNAICMNVTANLLGLGNAATPFGIHAIKEMQKTNPLPHTANNSMIMFVVLNTASIQLIPTFISILRQKYGAENPFDILPAMWITSIAALIVGIITTKLFEIKEIRK